MWKAALRETTPVSGDITAVTIDLRPKESYGGAVGRGVETEGLACELPHLEDMRLGDADLEKGRYLESKALDQREMWAEAAGKSQPSPSPVVALRTSEEAGIPERPAVSTAFRREICQELWIDDEFKAKAMQVLKAGPVEEIESRSIQKDDAGALLATSASRP